MKKKELRVLELGVQKKDTLRIKETVTLASNKPNIHEILWKDMEVRGLELRPEENKVNAKASCFCSACMRVMTGSSRCSGWNRRFHFTGKWSAPAVRRK